MLKVQCSSRISQALIACQNSVPDFCKLLHVIKAFPNNQDPDFVEMLSAFGYEVILDEHGEDCFDSQRYPDLFKDRVAFINPIPACRTSRATWRRPKRTMTSLWRPTRLRDPRLRDPRLRDPRLPRTGVIGLRNVDRIYGLFRSFINPIPACRTSRATWRRLKRTMTSLWTPTRLRDARLRDPRLPRTGVIGLRNVERIWPLQIRMQGLHPCPWGILKWLWTQMGRNFLRFRTLERCCLPPVACRLHLRIVLLQHACLQLLRKLP